MQQFVDCDVSKSRDLRKFRRRVTSISFTLARNWSPKVPYDSCPHLNMAIENIRAITLRGDDAHLVVAAIAAIERARQVNADLRSLANYWRKITKLHDDALTSLSHRLSHYRAAQL